MDNYCSEAISSYLDRLRETFEIVPMDKGCLIVAPFLRSDNSYFEIELLQQPNGKILLTDNADTISYLFIQGLNIRRSRELRRLINNIAARFNVDIQKDEIFKESDVESLDSSMESMINAMQDVSYLIYKKLKRGPVSFYDEVEKFLMSNEVRYDPQYQVSGRSYTHKFRFHMNEDRRMLFEPLTATSHHVALVRAERLAFWWVDIREVHPEYRKIALLDDIEKKESFWFGKPRDVLEEYSDKVVVWSNKQDVLETVLE